MVDEDEDDDRSEEQCGDDDDQYSYHEELHEAYDSEPADADNYNPYEDDYSSLDPRDSDAWERLYGTIDIYPDDDEAYPE